MQNMGTPWLDQPVLLHSSRADTCTLTAEQCAYRSGYWRYWYRADWVFALGTTYMLLAVTILCCLGFWGLRLSPSWLRRKPWWQKFASSIRFLAYQSYEVKSIQWHTPSVGASLLLAIGAVFFFAMTLGPQPYYWPNTKSLNFGSSPPIATRTGWMALACLPFVVILPAKSNMIASLTGVSHERLVLFHTWLSWAMFVLALIHTFPFIVFHTWKGDMASVWKTQVTYWTGVVAIIAQAYLTFMSFPWLRNKFYEFFKATHYLASIIFIIFFFLHCDFRLTSWDYFIATGVLYTLSFLYSQIRAYFEFGLSHRARFHLVSDRALKITISTNTTWQPGQHMFLRFLTLGLHSFTAHPFTICSFPVAASGSGKTELVFYVHPRGGLTGRLAKLAAEKPGFTSGVLLDGPYGGLKSRPLYAYDRGLIIAAGSGAGFALSFIMDWILHSPLKTESDQEKPRKKLQVVIITRDAQLLTWFEEGLTGMLAGSELKGLADVDITVYRTSTDQPCRRISDDSNDIGDKPTLGAETNKLSGQIIRRVVSGRPDIKSIVREAAQMEDITLSIATCGPTDVVRQVHDEAAAAQLRILRSQPGAKEVYLHSELFSW